jgi:hypothetical protein
LASIPAVPAFARWKPERQRPSYIDQAGDEALSDSVVDLRKAHHRSADALRNQRHGRHFRSARLGVRGRNRRIFFGRSAARRQEREPTGNEHRPVGTREHSAEGLDGAPVGLTVRREFEKSWLNAR